jgi:hypothetical protein
LKVAGRDFDVDAYLQSGTLVPVGVYRRSESRFPTLPRARKSLESGFNVVVAQNAISDFEVLVEDALGFLGHHRQAIRTLRRRKGVESVTLDFRLQRSPEPMPVRVFPEGLVRLAGELGLGLELSLYPAPDPTPPGMSEGPALA